MNFWFKMQRFKGLVWVVFVASPFLLLAFWNLWIPSSYWVDELYSIVVSSDSWSFLVGAIFLDVHPPLYQILLKLWVDAFGNGEIATRILSAMFAFGSFGVLLYGLRERQISFLIPVATFFASSWLFPYYAHEARSYSMLLFFATAATVQDLARINNPEKKDKLLWFITLLLLSLSHYFGLLLSFVFLISDLLRQRHWEGLCPRLVLGAILLVWPGLHFFLGGIEKYTGGNHWIISEGPGTTARMFAEGVFAAPIWLMDNFEKISIPLWLGFILFNSVIFVIMIVQTIIRTSGEIRREILYQFIYISLFIITIGLIDLHTPVSWPRYFIVLLPMVSISFGFIVHFFWNLCSRNYQKILLGFGVFFYVIFSSYYSYKNMAIRWGSEKGWKGLANIVNASSICRPHCWFYGNDFKVNLYEYYFSANMGTSPEKVILPLENLLNLRAEEQFPIVAGHIHRNHIDKLREHYSDWKCFEPEEISQTNVILMVPESYKVSKLKACPE